MSDRRALARKALRSAMELRRDLAIPREAPVNAFDIADMVGADVRFLDTPSLEGMLVRDPGLRVLLPSTRHRPIGRILFSCAHEVAHHYLGHGTRVDTYIECPRRRQSTDEEFLAETFAAYLLMPRPAVMTAYKRRGWIPESASASQTYVVASELGVAYGALLHHADAVLKVLSAARRKALEKSTPKAIRKDLLGCDCGARVVVVDADWRHVPIDLEVGDYLILPRNTGSMCSLLLLHGERAGCSVYSTHGPGASTLALSNDVSLRVARKHYVGPFSNRYLADPDEHDSTDTD